MIQAIEIKNITAFDYLSLNFSKGLNVLIGENGTGKTHLQKLLYFGCNNYERGNNPPYILDLVKAFGVKPNELIHDINISDASVLIKFSDTEAEALYIPGNTEHINHKTGRKGNAEETGLFMMIPSKHKHDCVFIPEKDMLTHSRGLLAMAKKYGDDFPFNKPMLEIIEKAQRWTLKEKPHLANVVLPILQYVFEGEVVYKKDSFYVQTLDGKEIEFSLEAEGYKRFALLWLLVMNESIKEDTILILDEPDTNINPKNIPYLAEALLALQREGVQIFLSTHSYIFAKYIEVRKTKNDIVRFISLYKENGAVRCEEGESFSDLKHNDITESFMNLLDEVYNS